MKKILTLILCLLLLLPPAAGCSSGLESQSSQNESAEETTEQATAEKPAFIPDIPEENRLTQAKIDAIPIAKDGMTEEQLRQICLDFFRLSQTFAWMPDEPWDYTIGSNTTVHTLRSGTVYGGFPYLHGAGNIYRLLPYYDEETGVVDMEKATVNQRYFGNFCSYGSGWGFSRVINSASHELTQDMVPANGYIPVGPYKMNMELTSFPEKETINICSENGKEIMFQSYAAAKPADALVYYTTGGHITMITSVHVEYNPDGTIDGAKSYVTFLDQDTGWEDHTLENGKCYKVQGGVDTKMSFNKLFSAAYIPYTFAEFLGTDPVEPGSVTIDTDKTEITFEELRNCTIQANYMISDIYVDFLDKDGKVADSRSLHTGYGGIMKMSLEKGLHAGSLKKCLDGTHTAKITCRIGNGELLPVWEGKITGER